MNKTVRILLVFPIVHHFSNQFHHYEQKSHSEQFVANSIEIA